MNVSTKVDVVVADVTPATAQLEANEPEAAELAEVTPDGSDHDHKPVQHRDSKERWCKTCGLTTDRREPGPRHAVNQQAGR